MCYCIRITYVYYDRGVCCCMEILTYIRSNRFRLVKTDVSVQYNTFVGIVGRLCDALIRQFATHTHTSWPSNMILLESCCRVFCNVLNSLLSVSQFAPAETVCCCICFAFTHVMNRTTLPPPLLLLPFSSVFAILSFD